MKLTPMTIDLLVLFFVALNCVINVANFISHRRDKNENRIISRKEK